MLLALVLAGLVVSGLAPASRLTWLLEIAPVLLGLPILILTYRRFPLTPLAYRLTFVLAGLLIVGGHYDYAKVPVGLAVQEALGLKRNDYDRFVHFFGGFVPAILGRELLRRRTRVRREFWLFVFVTSGCLAGAAVYEILEWQANRWFGSAATAFLATQGDLWDSQADMFVTVVGAMVGQLLLRRRHERELVRLAGPGRKSPSAQTLSI